MALNTRILDLAINFLNKSQKKLVNKDAKDLLSQYKKQINNELIFSPHSQKYRCWSNKYSNISIPKDGIQQNAVAAVVFISIEEGLEYFDLFKFSVKSADFQNSIQDLRQINPQSKVVLFMDNLRLHQSKLVQETIKNYGWTCVFNAPYSPSYHCIEEVFSIVKRNYRGKLLEVDYNLNQNKHNKIIKDSILEVKKDHIIAIIRRHIMKMRELLK